MQSNVVSGGRGTECSMVAWWHPLHPAGFPLRFCWRHIVDIDDEDVLRYVRTLVQVIKWDRRVVSAQGFLELRVWYQSAQERETLMHTRPLCLRNVALKADVECADNAIGR